MAWSLKANDMFPNVITKISSSLVPDGFVGEVSSIRLMQMSVTRVVDDLGAQSAAAQGLNKIITSAEKLRVADNHTLYLYKDDKAQGGAGRVVGLLKVGHKHLFLSDEAGRVIEAEPLCVLDFFVVPASQRKGIGRALFEHMLQDQRADVRCLAFDGPSDFLQAFLRHKYNVPQLIKQNNNFSVSPDFFHHVQPIKSKSEASTPASAPVGRYAVAKPQSTIANVIHGDAGGASGAHDAPHTHSSSEASGSAFTPGAPPAPAPAAPTPAGQGSSPPRPCTLPVSAAPPTAPATPTPAGAPSRRDSQLTDKGFFDVKFYHKKLW